MPSPILLVWAVLAVLLPGSASAAASYTHIGEFGGSGAAAGLFSASQMPQRMAVHGPSGKVFVADRGNNRVQVFSPTQVGAEFAFSIPVATPIGIALDPVNGDLYVSSAAAPVGIRKFNPDSSVNPTAYVLDATWVSPPAGAGTGEIGTVHTGNNTTPNREGIAVDPITRDVLLVDTTKNVIYRYDRTGWQGGAGLLDVMDGASGSRPAFTGLMDIAVTADGDIVAADLNGTVGRVDRYTADGTLEATLTQGSVPVPNTIANFSLIAVGASHLNGEIFVSSKTGSTFAPDPGAIYQFVNDLWDGGTVTVGNGRFSGLGTFAIAASSSGDDRLYVLATDAVFSPIVPRVQVFQVVQAPDVTIEQPSSVTPTSATLAGEVTAHGGQTTYRFEYRAVGASTWTAAPQPDGDLGAQPGSFEVQVSVTGLEPNTDYEARLLATTSGATTASNPVPFRTEVAAPVVDTRSAALLTTSSALLRGRVNPRNSATTYWFEWGPDASYGNVIPLTPRDAGAGGATMFVSEALAGLEPGRTYHYRLVARNDAEPAMIAEGPDRTFTTLAAPLPARAYEVVSRMPTGGAHVDFVSAAESDDGRRVLYYPAAAHDPFPGFDLPHQWYLAERDPTSGWHTSGADVIRFMGYVADVFTTVMAPSSLQPDRLVIRTTGPFDPDDANEDHADIVIGRDLYQRQPGGGLRWISRDPRIPQGTPQTNAAPVGEGNAVGHAGGPLSSLMSADGSRFVFPSRRQLLDADTTASACHRLYKWEGESLRFIGIRPDGSVPSFGGSGDLCSGPGGGTYAPNAVSRDGARVIWGSRRHNAALASMRIYVDDDGTTVEAVDETVPTLPSPHPLGVAYQGADVMGDTVLFTSTSRLTPDSGASHAASPAHADLYLYDVEGRQLHNLTPRLDGGTDPNVAPAVGDRARVRGVVAVSEDGRTVYFVADAALDAADSPLGRQPVEGSPNLYRARLGEPGDPPSLRFVARLGGTEGHQDANLWSGPWRGRTALASPDGRVLGFGSVASVTDQPTAGTRQVYVYDDAVGTLDCASCPPGGGAPAGDANGPVAQTGTAVGWQTSRIFAPPGVKRWVSATGTVFFDTPTPLLPEDRNSERDVYEYSHGALRLISAGDTASAAATFSGASRDGSTVFFTTTTALVPQDGEGGVRKIYAARVGGGFPVTAPTPPCAGDACQGSPSREPATITPGTAGWRGAGNQTSPRRASATMAVRVPKSRRGPVASIRVRVPAAGRITVAGRAVRPLSRRVGRAGWQRLRVALKPAPRRRLARRARLTVAVRVTFAARAGGAMRRTVRVSYVRPATSATADRSTTGGDR